jgi:hypothetical protein
LPALGCDVGAILFGRVQDFPKKHPPGRHRDQAVEA